MMGLEPRHVRERTLLIDQAVAHGRLKVQKTGRIYRTVDLFPLLRDDLLTWQGTARGRSGSLLFGRDDGDPWTLDDWNNWRNRCFHKASKAAGPGKRRPYELRHSFASLLIREQRQSVVDLADQLGHAPTMTLDTYSHVMREHRGAPPREAEGWIREARRNAGTV
jgi:integrase